MNRSGRGVDCRGPRTRPGPRQTARKQPNPRPLGTAPGPRAVGQSGGGTLGRWVRRSIARAVGRAAGRADPTPCLSLLRPLGRRAWRRSGRSARGAKHLYSRGGGRGGRSTGARATTRWRRMESDETPHLTTHDRLWCTRGRYMRRTHVDNMCSGTCAAPDPRQKASLCLAACRLTRTPCVARGLRGRRGARAAPKRRRCGAEAAPARRPRGARSGPN